MSTPADTTSDAVRPAGSTGVIPSLEDKNFGSNLEVSNLTVCMTRSRIPVVTDVSFSVPAGHIMGLVGESGSGKSTVGLALLGYVRRGLDIDAGSVQLGNVSVLELSGTALRRARGALASYVPQDPASGLNPALRLGPSCARRSRSTTTSSTRARASTTASPSCSARCSCWRPGTS
jgi:ABC-type glutathione transport system ATPase component